MRPTRRNSKCAPSLALTFDRPPIELHPSTLPSFAKKSATAGTLKSAPKHPGKFLYFPPCPILRAHTVHFLFSIVAIDVTQLRERNSSFLALDQDRSAAKS